MRSLGRKFKKGAASFYIVAFATLILVVVAASFAVVIISAVSRASNDDLSQSAYDAALAGVEDAKLAYANYRACLEKNSSYPDNKTNDPTVSCQDIVYWMKNPDCDMVGHILGRIGKNDKSEVLIQETATTSGGSSNNINEAYTCVKIETSLNDYRASLSSSNLYRVVKVNLGEKAKAKDIDKVKISWYSNRDGAVYNFTNVLLNQVAFQPVNATKVATPPTIAVGLIQTAGVFTLDQLNGKNEGATTDRAMMYFVPTDNATMAGTQNENNYIGLYSDGGKNKITSEQIVSTNDHMKDLPFVVYCDPGSTEDFMCSVTMDLPEPINGNRSDETFMFTVSLPYEQPDTDFALEFYCKDGTVCSETVKPDGTIDTSNQNKAKVEGVQVVIDSTGRANDLYRRVEVRLEATDALFTYPKYAIQVLGDDSGGSALINKNMTITAEHN